MVKPVAWSPKRWTCMWRMLNKKWWLITIKSVRHKSCQKSRFAKNLRWRTRSKGCAWFYDICPPTVFGPNYKSFNYSGDLKSNHSKSGLFEDWISNSPVFKGMDYCYGIWKPEKPVPNDKSSIFLDCTHDVTQVLLFSTTCVIKTNTCILLTWKNDNDMQMFHKIFL